MRTFEYGCKDCIFYQPAWDKEKKKNKEQGACRFNPPLPMINTDGMFLGLFPPIHEEAWCGRFVFLKPDEDSIGANPIVPSGIDLVGES